MYVKVPDTDDWSIFDNRIDTQGTDFELPDTVPIEGPQGPPPTQAQLETAIAAYFTANPQEGLSIRDEGTTLGLFHTLDFRGPSMAATDYGAGIARVTVGPTIPTPTPTPPLQLGWVAWSVDNVFTETEILAGEQEVAAGYSAPIPDRAGMFQFFAIWLPGTRWSSVTGVFFSAAGQPRNNIPQIGTFESAIPFTVDGVDGMLRVQTNRQGRLAIGGTVYWE